MGTLLFVFGLLVVGYIIGVCIWPTKLAGFLPIREETEAAYAARTVGMSEAERSKNPRRSRENKIRRNVGVVCGIIAVFLFGFSLNHAVMNRNPQVVNQTQVSKVGTQNAEIPGIYYIDPSSDMGRMLEGREQTHPVREEQEQYNQEVQIIMNGMRLQKNAAKDVLAALAKAHFIHVRNVRPETDRIYELEAEDTKGKVYSLTIELTSDGKVDTIKEGLQWYYDKNVPIALHPENIAITDSEKSSVEERAEKAIKEMFAGTPIEIMQVEMTRGILGICYYAVVMCPDVYPVVVRVYCDKTNNKTTIERVIPLKR